MKTLESTFPLVIIRSAYFVRWKDEEYVVQWVEVYNDDNLPPRDRNASCLTVTDLSGVIVADFDLSRAIKLEAMRFRIIQIREDLELQGEVTDMSVVSALLERVWEGEWMGQFNESQVIYISEVADLLHIPMKDIWSLVQKLVEERKADVLPSTYILSKPLGLTPLDQYQEMYGHKKYASSDFGYWTCKACGKSGDDYEDSEKFSCVSDH